jgi:hypothetical protein
VVSRDEFLDQIDGAASMKAPEMPCAIGGYPREEKSRSRLPNKVVYRLMSAPYARSTMLRISPSNRACFPGVIPSRFIWKISSAGVSANEFTQV